MWEYLWPKGAPAGDHISCSRLLINTFPRVGKTFPSHDERLGSEPLLSGDLKGHLSLHSASDFPHCEGMRWPRQELLLQAGSPGGKTGGEASSGPSSEKESLWLEGAEIGRLHVRQCYLSKSDSYLPCLHPTHRNTASLGAPNHKPR